jgi:tetratricopeptide (TPR) repeat protein
MTQQSRPFDIGQALEEARALHRRGALREAERLYERVLKAAPGHFDALNLLGAVKAQQGRLGEAQRLFAAATKAGPDLPQGWANLGQALHGLKRPAEALECLDRARALAPDDINILCQRAAVLLTLDRPNDVLADMQSVLSRAPQQFDAWMNYGTAQAALQRPEEALAAFDRALALAPGHPIIQYNRGVALLQLGRYAQAIAANDAALAAIPQHVNAWLNRGRALAQLNRHDEAIASYGEALALAKNHPDAHFNKALSLLARGDYAEGFADYEWRWRRTGMPQLKSRGRPLWLGDYALANKTVLLHAEQGLGDTIQFARYAPLLAAQGAKVVLEVQPELKALVRNLEGITAVVARGEAPPPFDAHVPLGSLPLALKTTLSIVPANVPYLAADPAKVASWSSRLASSPPPRIAIAWSGNASHQNDRNRSIAFACLAPLLAAPACFLSIQRDVRPADAVALAGENRVLALGDALADFGETAALLMLCDLVIAVDTAAVHLAGALGRPVWVLLPFAADWRWGVSGESTPWYPTARLFRQSAPDDWDGVIASVAAALKDFIGGAAAGR